ncbi:MAG: hypothetical protein K0R38_7804 [Polyangiaceae bacterium]|nr:hypothetical protein [Polyangiaceae bacterium]
MAGAGLAVAAWPKAREFTHCSKEPGISSSALAANAPLSHARLGPSPLAASRRAEWQ